MKGRLPNLLVIGAMKAGTTSLHDYLGKHPDVYMSDPKEIHYYADANYKKWSREKYMSFFQTDCKYAGTSPQSYTKCHNKYYENIPERIHKDTPDVKMIYIVRDPIERYKSHILESYYCDNMDDIKYSQQSGHYFKTSMYGMQLKQYLKFFEIDQIHILALEDLQDNPLVEMNKIFTFLGLPAMHGSNLFIEKRNSSESKGVPRVISDHILFRAGRKINKKLSYEIANIIASIFFKNQIAKPNLLESEIDELKRLLIDDINDFRRISGKDFNHWSL